MWDPVVETEVCKHLKNGNDWEECDEEFTISQRFPCAQETLHPNSQSLNWKIEKWMIVNTELWPLSSNHAILCPLKKLCYENMCFVSNFFIKWTYRKLAEMLIFVIFSYVTFYLLL